MFFIEIKLLSYFLSRHDFNVKAVSALGNQPAADSLLQGNDGGAAAKYISNVYHRT